MLASSLPTPALRSHAGWLQDLRTTIVRRRVVVVMAGLLAFAAPLKFFVGFTSVAQQAPLSDLLEMAAWWILNGCVLWAGLLASGVVAERARLDAPLAWRLGRSVLLAAACASAASIVSHGRAHLLIEHGVVQGALPMQYYAIALSFSLALLFFVLLDRTLRHERATTRLAIVQAEQREARRRSVQMDLQTVQARIDPVLLFDMLEAVKLAYESDAARAEALLDELIAFLRACLPSLRVQASSIPREADLARAYVGLLSRASGGEWALRLDLTSDALHARFPPGIVLPLVGSALRGHGGHCSLQARCEEGVCHVAIQLPSPPDPASVAQVEALLGSAEATEPCIVLEQRAASCLVTIRVPHEPA